MNQKTVEKILQDTEQGYDIMAEKFSQTRKYFWRGLEFIADYAKNGNDVLDFGCGNGRLLELFPDRDINYLGTDVSEKLIRIAKERYPNEKYKFRKISGFGSLALPEDSFNSVFSVAVFHHLPSRELRLKIAKELFSTLKPGGAIVITVWNLWQKKYFKNILSNWIDKIFGKSDMGWNDCYVTFKNNQGEIFNRYHHALTLGELKYIFEEAGFAIEKCEIINKRNILLIGRK